jgi:hypothetical protein
VTTWLRKNLSRFVRRMFPYHFKPGDQAMWGQVLVTIYSVKKHPQPRYYSGLTGELVGSVCEVYLHNNPYMQEIPICELRPATREELVAWKLRQ